MGFGKEATVTDKPLLMLLTLATLFAAGGAACPRMLQQYTAAPIVFEGEPTLDRSIAVVNANSEKIQQLQSTGATIKVAGVPSLRASLSYERSRRFRLIADTSITGVELDMGSNDHEFWMWVKRNRPPAVYFCRHEEFQGSAVRDVLPIEPSWIAEALGVVYFDPRGRHDGPHHAGEGRLEIRSKVPTADGEVTKVTVIHSRHGWVLEQHVFDVNGRHIASAIASHHRYDPGTGVTLPRHIEVQLPTIEMSFTLEVSDYIVNSLTGDPETLWARPDRNSVPPVDLGRLARDSSRLLTPQFEQAPRSYYERP